MGPCPFEIGHMVRRNSQICITLCVGGVRIEFHIRITLTFLINFFLIKLSQLYIPEGFVDMVVKSIKQQNLINKKLIM